MNFVVTFEKWTFVWKQLSWVNSRRNGIKSTFEQIFLFLWVSRPAVIQDSNSRDESPLVGGEWRTSVRQLAETASKASRLKDKPFFLMEEEYVALDCFFCSCVKWRNQKTSFYSEASFSSALPSWFEAWILCKRLQKLLPILPRGTGPSHLQHNRCICGSN